MINDVIQQVLKNSRGKIRANVQHQVFGESIPYRAEDFRVIQGGPIDALFFEGLFEKRKQINVILADRKTGFSNVNTPQRKVAEAIEAHCLGAKDRVRFELFGDHQPQATNPSA